MRWGWALHQWIPRAGPSPCGVDPDVITTENLAVGALAPGSAAGVYTHVQWDLTDDAGDPLFGINLGVSASTEIMYAAGIPLRENTMTFGVAPTPPIGELANLDNNSGARTTDEQQLINYATASGTYDPGGLATATSDTDAETVIAEDLSIHKSVDDDVFVQNENPRWRLIIETGEYRTAANLRITDVLPDGQCPLLTSGSSESPLGSQTAECDNGAVGSARRHHRRIGR